MADQSHDVLSAGVFLRGRKLHCHSCASENLQVLADPVQVADGLVTAEIQCNDCGRMFSQQVNQPKEASDV